MIDLYFWPTGNGKKIVILLEELGLPYTIKPINIGRGDQLTPEFLKISPNGRMPAIVDHEPMGGGDPISIFESGAIMTYLAEKTGRFCPTDPRGKYDVAQWVSWQMANQGPKLGEQGHFRRALASGKNGDLTYALRRFDNEAHRIFGVMNLGLFNKRYLAAGAIHDRRHDLLSVGFELGDPRHRHRRVPQCEALAGRNRRAAGRQERRWRWDRSSARTRPRSAPRSRHAVRNWWRTSGRSRSRRNGWPPRKGNALIPRTESGSPAARPLGGWHVNGNGNFHADVRRRMADPVRSRRLLSPRRHVRMVGPDQHPHHGARAGAARPFPDQPLRSAVRRDHRIVAGQDRCRGQQGRTLGHRGQQRRLRDTQRGPHGAAGAGLRAPHPHDRRLRRVDAEGRAAAAQPACAAGDRRYRLSRLRRHRAKPRGTRAPARRFR